MSKTKIDHLEVFSKSKTRMASGQPNIKEWSIVDHTGQQIGTVYDMLFDKESNVIRYVITNLKNGKLLEQDRLVLMPVGKARIKDSQNEVVFENITRDQIQKLPDFLTVDHLTEEDEYAVRNAFRSSGEDEVSSENTDRSSFYDHEVFSTDNFYSSSNVSNSSQENRSSVGNGDNVIGRNSETNRDSSGTTQNSGDRKDDGVNVHPDPDKRSTDITNTGNIGKSGSDFNKS